MVVTGIVTKNIGKEVLTRKEVLNRLEVNSRKMRNIILKIKS